MKRIVIAASAIAALIVIVGTTGFVYWQSRGDEVNLLTEAPPIVSAGQTASTLPESDMLAFEIVPAESKATYVVREKLSNLPASNNAVGSTSAISGTLYLTEEGLADGEVSTFSVDLRTLTSDESRRDNFIRMNTLQANQFPFAEYVIESVEGFPADYIKGEEIDLVLNGEMTIKGTTRALTFQVKARQAGDTLTAIADTAFKMTDFGLEPPQLGFVTVENDMQLQVVIVARAAGSGAS